MKMSLLGGAFSCAKARAGAMASAGAGRPAPKPKEGPSGQLSIVFGRTNQHYSPLFLAAWALPSHSEGLTGHDGQASWEKVIPPSTN